MNLEALKTRKQQLETARNNIANSLQVLNGHVAECDYYIDNYETLVVQPVVENDENVVE